MSFLMLGHHHHHGRPPHCILGFSEAKREKNLAEQECRFSLLAGKNETLNSDRGKNASNLFRSESSSVKLVRPQSSSSGRRSSVSNKVNVGPNTENAKNIGDEILLKDKKMDQSSLSEPSSPTSSMSTGISNARVKNGKDVSRKNQLENSNGKDWRILSQTLSSRQKFSSISNHELLRLAELRFSNDMQEGDSGTQVLLLQKALFWLGYLSTESGITGYFGTETKQALCEFQDTHGVHQTAIWSTLSKQALWHIVSGEILHRVADEEMVKAAIPNTDSRVQAWQSWQPTKFAETFEAVIPHGEWRLLSGIALLATGIFLGLFVSRYAQNRSLNDKSTKRRIIWASANQNSILPPQQDVISSSSLNGATVATENSIQTGSPNTSMKNMDSVAQINDAHAVVDKVIRDPQSQLKRVPSSHTFKRIGREALGLSTSETTKSVVQASLKRPTSSKAAFELSYSGKQRESWVRPTQVSEGSNQKTSSSGTQGSIHHRKQNDQFDNLSATASHIKDVASTSHKVRMEMPSKNLKFSFPMNGKAKTLNRENEPNIRRRIEELHKAVEAAEQYGQDAVNALEEERKRSVELEEKISQQRECAAALEEEVRGLKESHDVLLKSVRKNL